MFEAITELPTLERILRKHDNSRLRVFSGVRQNKKSSTDEVNYFVQVQRNVPDQGTSTAWESFDGLSIPGVSSFESLLGIADFMTKNYLGIEDDDKGFLGQNFVRDCTSFLSWIDSNFEVYVTSEGDNFRAEYHVVLPGNLRMAVFDSVNTTIAKIFSEGQEIKQELRKAVISERDFDFLKNEENLMNRIRDFRMPNTRLVLEENEGTYTIRVEGFRGELKWTKYLELETSSKDLKGSIEHMDKLLQRNKSMDYMRLKDSLGIFRLRQWLDAGFRVALYDLGKTADAVYQFRTNNGEYIDAFEVNGPTFEELTTTHVPKGMQQLPQVMAAGFEAITNPESIPAEFICSKHGVYEPIKKQKELGFGERILPLESFYNSTIGELALRTDTADTILLGSAIYNARNPKVKLAKIS